MKLRTIGLISSLVLGLLAGSLSAEAQQAGKVYRVGWLRFSPRPPTSPNHVAFRQKLNELGYVEGKNLVIEYRSAKRKPERRPKLAAELVRLNVDVIVTFGAQGLFVLHRGQRARSLLSLWASVLILLRLDMSTALQGPEATLR